MKYFLLFFLVFSIITPVFATDVMDAQMEQFGADDLTDGLGSSAESLMGDISMDNLDFSNNLVTIVKDGFYQSFSAVKSALVVAVSMMGVILLCALVTQMEGHFSKHTIVMTGVLALTILSVSSIGSMVDLGRETLEELQAFTALLFPILATATAASGGVATSTALYAGSIFVSNALIATMNYFLVPLIYAYLAVSAAGALLANQALKKIKELMKWAVTNGIKLLLYGFSAYLSLSGIVSGVGDATAIKAVKLTFSAVVPVVGAMIADSTETLLVSASMIRNAIGIFGMLAIIAICILPLLRLTIQYIVLKITSAVCATIGDPQLTNLMESVGDAMGFLAGMTGACGFMMLISCVCTVKAVTG